MTRSILDYDTEIDISRDEFIHAVREKSFSFPFKRHGYTLANIQDKMTLLKRYCFEDRVQYKEYKLRNVHPFTIKNFNAKGQEFKDVPSPGFTFLGKPIVLTSHESDYENFNILSDIFQEKHRMKARVYTHQQSPWDYFYENTGDVYDKTIELYKTITPRHVREALWKVTREATSFRPTNIIAIIQMFNSTKVLDFCAGWGDRLLGAIAAGVPYTGIDPNPVLHKGYQKIIKTFAENPENYVMIENIAQTAVIPGNDYDLIFTSPPYFDLEVYIPPGNPGEELQSIFTNKTEQSWFNDFLIPAMKNAYNHLAKNGKMVININQKNRNETYVRNMITQMIRDCKDIVYLGVIGYSNERHTDNVQPMWVFTKIG
jgi:16S rRNA G966 N2-methylase RsmD